VLEVLNRDRHLDSLGALAHSLQDARPERTLNRTAIAFDTNVLLRLGNHSKSADIIDYLTSASFGGSIILPGQVIQEFWNNQLNAVDSLAASIRKKFEALSAEVSKIDDRFYNFEERFNTLLEEFRGTFGHAYDGGTAGRLGIVVKFLQEKAIVPYVSRAPFAEMAVARKRTRTPPGFKDDGDGDFYVWVDLLAGLLQIRRSGTQIDRVALLSQDRKLDWSRDGIPHPILAAEVEALTGATFEIWTLDQLAGKLP